MHDRDVRTKIVVGVDGSEHSARAVEWAAEYAAGRAAEVVVAHVVPVPISLAMGPYRVYERPTTGELDELRRVAELDWCKRLADAGIAYRVVIATGTPASELLRIADVENADLVVTGRRGLGGFAELLLGSTSHQVAHHLHCPLTIVP